MTTDYEQEGECPVCYTMGPVYTECDGSGLGEPHESAEFLP